MYLEGGPHPNRTAAQAQLTGLIAAGEALVTDAEVLQEIVHRYSGLGRRDAVGPVLARTLQLVDQVFPVTREVVLRGAEIVQSQLGLSARDAVHLAVMERHRLRRILTFDAAFERWPGIERIGG